MWQWMLYFVLYNMICEMAHLPFISKNNSFGGVGLLLQKTEDMNSKSQSCVWKGNYNFSGLRSRKPSALASACPSVWVTGTIALATYSSEYRGSFRNTKIIMGAVSFLFVTRLHHSVDQTFWGFIDKSRGTQIWVYHRTELRQVARLVCKAYGEPEATIQGSSCS